MGMGDAPAYDDANGHGALVRYPASSERLLSLFKPYCSNGIRVHDCAEFLREEVADLDAALRIKHKPAYYNAAEVALLHGFEGSLHDAMMPIFLSHAQPIDLKIKSCLSAQQCAGLGLLLAGDECAGDYGHTALAFQKMHMLHMFVNFKTKERDYQMCKNAGIKGIALLVGASLGGGIAGAAVMGEYISSPWLTVASGLGSFLATGALTRQLIRRDVVRDYFLKTVDNKFSSVLKKAPEIFDKKSPFICSAIGQLEAATYGAQFDRKAVRLLLELHKSGLLVQRDRDKMAHYENILRCRS